MALKYNSIGNFRLFQQQRINQGCNFITLFPFQVEKKTFFVIPEEIATQERTSFFTNLFMDYTTWALLQTVLFQALMKGWASDTTTWSERGTDGGIRTPCQPTGSISRKGLRVTSTATTNKIHQTESTTTSIRELSWKVTTRCFMAF